MLILVLPTASWLPKSLILQFRLVSEEESHSTGVTLAETSHVRRKIPSLSKDGKLPLRHHGSARLQSSHSQIADRSEYRFVNGIGAPLRR